MQLVCSLKYNSVAFLFKRQEQDGPTLYIHRFVQNLFNSNVKSLTGILSCTFVYADHLQKLYTFVWYLHVYDPDS